MRQKLYGLWSNEKIRFLFVGGFNTVFGLFFFYLTEYLFGAKIGYLGSLYASFIIVSITSFLLYRYLVFRVRGKIVKDFLSFITVYLIPLGANTIVLPILVSGAGLNVYIAQTMIVIFSTIVSYLGHKHFSFRRTRSSTRH